MRTMKARPAPPQGFPLFLLTLAVALWLAPDRAVAATVEKIIISSGAGGESVSEELVRVNLRCVEGAEYSEKALSDDIKRLYDTGQFAGMPVAKVSESAPGKVTITLQIEPKPRVRSIHIEYWDDAKQAYVDSATFAGTPLIKAKVLRKLVQQQEQAVLKEKQVAEDVNALRKKYQDKGYFQSRVMHVTEAVPEGNQVDLFFRIQEEPRVKVRSVRFVGTHGVITDESFTLLGWMGLRDPDKPLRRKMLTKRSWWGYLFPTGFLDGEKLELDKDAVRELYTGKGYLDFRILRVEQEVNAKRTKVNLTIYVDEGQPYTVDKVEVVIDKPEEAGKPRFEVADLQKDVRLEPGKLFDSNRETEDIRRLRARYEVLGYLDLRCTAERTPDTERHTVVVRYRIEEGKPCRIRDIHIAGNEMTKDYVLRRELVIQPGDLGDAGKVRTSRARLMGMNYFESVEITPSGTETEGEKDLLINVTEKRTGQFNIGAGISSDEDVVGFMELTQNNFDWRDWSNWWRGGGQRLRLRLQAGTRRQDFSISFTEPWWLDRRLVLDLDVFYNQRDQREYLQQTAGGQVRVTQPLVTDWRMYYGLRPTNTRLSDFSTGSAELLAEEGSYVSDALLWGVIWDTRNRPINPSQGHRVSLDLSLAPEALGSYSNVYRAGVDGVKYFPLVKDCVFKVEGELGVVDKISGDEVAIFDRYFAGGTYSLRGFKRREVGPIYTDATGEDPKGGKSLFRGTFEFIFPIYERIRGCFFADYGDVWSQDWDWHPLDVNVGVGPGVQIDLPVGAIRLDYGFPVVRQEEHLGNNGRLHFSLGYAF